MRQNTLRAIALLPIATAALACAPAAPTPTPAPVASSPSASDALDDIPLLVKMRAVHNVEDEEKAFLANKSLVNGDQVAYYVTPSKDAHVYIVQFSGGAGQLIYPGPGEGRLSAGEKARVPEDGWFEVFGCAGEEFLYVVASEKPLSESSGELAKVIEGYRGAEEEAPIECDEEGRAPGEAPAAAPSASASAAPAPPTPAPSATTTASAPAPPPKPRSFNVYAKKWKFMAFASRSLCTRPECQGTRAMKHVSSVYKGEANEDGVAVLEFMYDHQPGKK